jgi:hypothetical protein
MSLSGIFDRRVRGFRVVEVVGLGILLVWCWASTGQDLRRPRARRDRRIEQQIEDEKVRKRLLEGRGRLSGAAAPHRAAGPA